MVAEIAKNIPPFPLVREVLGKVYPVADIMVCSATPIEALEREWAEHNFRQYVRIIAGQEMGSKAQHLSIVSNGKYDKDKIIMLGDALGDLDAARKKGVHFYPIIPGSEEASWKRFYDEAFDKFIAGRYEGDYEEKMIEEFQKCLPDHPVWQRN
ncbi:MAG: hypothetical protein L0Y36_02100 [Planctomycetales bacterium]|nr:hypothetical protein [Planctomycetales bacterium]